VKNSKVPTADLHNLNKAWHRLMKNTLDFQPSDFRYPRTKAMKKTFDEGANKIRELFRELPKQQPPADGRIALCGSIRLQRQLRNMTRSKLHPTVTLRCKTKPAQERELQRRLAVIRARGYLGPVSIFYPDGWIRYRILVKHPNRNMYLVNTVE